ncbi:MAG TPA: hypothetical protein DCK95_05210 [Anaerolineaceae bacterium]|nr:hypothetical protein [Anaerolineaceae bacterium]
MVTRTITSKSNEKIPGENALKEKYGVSRHTLRLALLILTEDGLIKKSQGEGTIVTYKENTRVSNRQHIFNHGIQYSKVERRLVTPSYKYLLSNWKTSTVISIQRRIYRI